MVRRAALPSQMLCTAPFPWPTGDTEVAAARDDWRAEMDLEIEVGQADVGAPEALAEDPFSDFGVAEHPDAPRAALLEEAALQPVEEARPAA